jgi:hypothetical protein
MALALALAPAQRVRARVAPAPAAIRMTRPKYLLLCLDSLETSICAVLTCNLACDFDCLQVLFGVVLAGFFFFVKSRSQ